MHLLWHLDLGSSMWVFYMVFSQCGFVQSVFPMLVFLQAVFFSVGFSAGCVFLSSGFFYKMCVLQCGFFYMVCLFCNVDFSTG